jgi:hypothetical protein
MSFSMDMCRRRGAAAVLAMVLSATAAARCGHSGASSPQPMSAPPPATTPRSRDFTEALKAFRGTVLLLPNVPPAEENTTLRQSVDQLAETISATPTTVSVMHPALDTAAGVMRNEWVRWGTFLMPPADGAPDERLLSIKQALGTAEGALRTLSEQDRRYATQAISGRLDDLRGAVEGLDASQPLPDARPSVIAALQSAARVMDAVEQAAMAPPPT